MAGVDVPDDVVPKDVVDVEVFDTLDAAEEEDEADDVEVDEAVDGKLTAGVGVGVLTCVTVFTTATLAGVATTRGANQKVPSRTALSRASSS